MRDLAMTCSVAAVLLLSGCAHYRPQPLAPADSASRLTARSLDDPGLKAFLERHLQHAPDPSPASWDEQTLTLVAFYYHPSLDVARAQWQLSKAELISAGGRPNPTLGLSPGYDFSATRGVNPWIPGMNFDLPIETAGKRDHRIARASEMAEASRLNLAATAWQVQRNVRAGLFEVATAQERENVLGKQSDAQQEMVSRLEQRLKAGAVSASEILPLRSALAKTRVDHAAAASQNIEACSRLAEALGLPGQGNEIHAHGGWPVADKAAGRLTGAELRDRALKTRTDILGALAEYAALEAALQLEIAKQYPDIHFNPGYQYDQGDHKWTVGITAELPLLNQNQGPIAEAQARRVEAAARFTALQAKVIAEIDRSLALHELAAKQMGVAGQWLAAQQKQRESAMAQARAGAADAVDQLTAELDLGTAQIAAIEAQAKLRQAQIALEDAVQSQLDSIGSTTPVDLLRWVLLAPEPSGKADRLANANAPAAITPKKAKSK